MVLLSCPKLRQGDQAPHPTSTRHSAQERGTTLSKEVPHGTGQGWRKDPAVSYQQQHPGAEGPRASHAGTQHSIQTIQEEVSPDLNRCMRGVRAGTSEADQLGRNLSSPRPCWPVSIRITGLFLRLMWSLLLQWDSKNILTGHSVPGIGDAAGNKTESRLNRNIPPSRRVRVRRRESGAVASMKWPKRTAKSTQRGRNSERCLWTNHCKQPESKPR